MFTCYPILSVVCVCVCVRVCVCVCVCEGISVSQDMLVGPYCHIEHMN